MGDVQSTCPPAITDPARRYTVYSYCLPVHGGKYSDNTNLFESSAYSTARVVAKSPTGNVAADQKDPNLESQTGRASTAHIFVNPSRPAAVWDRGFLDASPFTSRAGRDRTDSRRLHAPGDLAFTRVDTHDGSGGDSPQPAPRRGARSPSKPSQPHPRHRGASGVKKPRMMIWAPRNPSQP